MLAAVCEVPRGGTGLRRRPSGRPAGFGAPWKSRRVRAGRSVRYGWSHPMVLQLDHDRRSVTFARRWILREAAAAGVRGHTRAIVELLTSELVSNALLHGPVDGQVSVRTTSDGDVFTVTVTDEGSGVPVLLRPPPTAEG